MTRTTLKEALRNGTTRLRELLSPVGNAYSMGAGPADRALARIRRPLDRLYLDRAGRMGALDRLGADAIAADPLCEKGPRVLITSLRGWSTHLAYEGTLAQALRLRGAEVFLLTCGGGQPICEWGWGRDVHPRPCDRCAWATDRYIETMRLPATRLGDTFPWGRDSRAAPSSLPPGKRAIAPAEAARISAAWILRTSSTDSVAIGPTVTREFEISAAAVADAAEHILDRFRPEVILMLNGQFTAEQVLRAAADARDIRVVTYEVATRPDAILLSQGDPAVDQNTTEIWNRVRDRPLDAGQKRQLAGLLSERERTAAGFFEPHHLEPAALRSSLGLDDRHRIVTMFTNLSWDSAVLYRDIGYESMLDWIERSIRSLARLDDTELIVRIHPAEAHWASRERVQEVMSSRLGTLPDNVRFIRPEETLSSYALMDISDLVLVYATTAGLESVLRGVPAAVAGQVHYRGQGFTYDIDSHDQLEEVLRNPPDGLAEAERERAERYAYTYFFRWSISFPLIHTGPNGPIFVPDQAARLAPGADPFLDFVCDRILDGEEFLLPDELAARSPMSPAPQGTDDRGPVSPPPWATPRAFEDRSRPSAPPDRVER